MNSIFYKIGYKITSIIEVLFSPIKVFPYTISALTFDIKNKRQSFSKLFIEEVYYYGVITIPIVCTLGAGTGVLLLVLFPFDTISFGIQNIYGYLFSIIILREFAPYLTTFVVMIRATVTITIQLAQMKINDEIETLELLGINPVQYLGSVKVLAGITALPVLTIYFGLSALLGCMLAAYIIQNVPMITFLNDVYDFISFRDILIFSLKSFSSGILIFIIAIFHGLSAEKSHNVIIIRTIRAVTTSIFTVLILNIVITVSLYAAR